MFQKLLPPFTEEIAGAKVQMAQDLWNARNRERVALAYTEVRRDAQLFHCHTKFVLSENVCSQE